MADVSNPTVRSRQVANQLRALREGARLTGAEVAKQLGMSPSKISRIETGHRGLTVDVVAALLGLYRVPDRQREQILDQVRKSAERGWWESRGLGLPESWTALINYESRAIRIQSYEALVVPGLLQTAEYIGAVVKAVETAITESELTNIVASRMARQAILRRQDLQFLVVIDEGALRRPLTESGVMRRQLRHLADDAERPSITIQVVPWQVGAHAGQRGAFGVLDFDDEPSLVYLENQSTCLFLDDPADVAAHRSALANIVNVALSPVESVELISKLAVEHA
jgi:transcriptional regulator with XRE-family HTH domain